MYGVLSICGDADRLRVEGSMSVDKGGFVEELALLIKVLIPALKPSQKQVFERPVCAKGEHHRAQATGSWWQFDCAAQATHTQRSPWKRLMLAEP